MCVTARHTATMREEFVLAYRCRLASSVVYGTIFSRKVPTDGGYFLGFVTVSNDDYEPSLY
ncbi:hypothetical protein IBA8401_47580 [Pseudomonas syringae]